MRLTDLFSEATLSDRNYLGSDFYTIPEEGHFIHIPKDGLTEREGLLLDYFTGTTSSLLDSSWAQFLNGQRGLPTSETAIQLITFKHAQDFPKDLKAFLRELIPNLLSIEAISTRTTLLVLKVNHNQDSSILIKDLLATLESDFEVLLKVFIGNPWTDLTMKELEAVLQAEYRLFQDYFQMNGEQATVSFSQAMLWSVAQERDVTILDRQLQRLMSRSKDSKELVVTLWQEHGNLAQTAQRLFIHRNSLQYRLEKWHQATGLHLKDLDDLALAYMLYLRD